MTAKKHLDEMTGLNWTSTPNKLTKAGGYIYSVRVKRKRVELRPTLVPVPRFEALEMGYGFGCMFAVYEVYVEGELVNAALSNEVRSVVTDVLAQVRGSHAR